jgi:mono/diheme cytochrome c family protein
MSSRVRSLISALLFLSVFAMIVAAQTTSSPQSTTPAQTVAKPEIKKVPPIYTNPSSGRQMFDAYCASCHGQGGKGNGPAAPALKTQPADLTQLSARNGGKFPEAHVVQIIRGDSLNVAHGNKEMPVWGPMFSNLSQHDQAIEQLRIRNLTKYLESMQQK